MKTAAKQWFTARVKIMDEEDGGTKDADGAPTFRKVTPQMQVVLDKNGMSALKDLFGLELSLFLGRPAAPPELEGAIFGAPPSVMLGTIFDFFVVGVKSWVLGQRPASVARAARKFFHILSGKHL